MPSLLACCFVSMPHAHGRYPPPGVARLPVYIGRLFLRWTRPRERGRGFAARDLARLNLLQANEDRSEWQRPASTSLEAIRLSLLAQATIQTVERYYLAIGAAASGQRQHHPGSARAALHLMAQRMSVLYGLNSPEFFDKACFAIFSICCAPKRDSGGRRRPAILRRAAAGGRRGCAARVVGADQT